MVAISHAVKLRMQEHHLTEILLNHLCKQKKNKKKKKKKSVGRRKKGERMQNNAEKNNMKEKSERMRERERERLSSIVYQITHTHTLKVIPCAAITQFFIILLWEHIYIYIYIYIILYRVTFINNIQYIYMRWIF